jgi:hypothetical protein
MRKYQGVLPNNSGKSERSNGKVEVIWENTFIVAISFSLAHVSTAVLRNLVYTVRKAKRLLEIYGKVVNSVNSNINVWGNVRVLKKWGNSNRKSLREER